MSIKFTTTEIESKNGRLELLFEFLDKELPEEISIDYMYELAKSKYIGSLQSAQIMGAYLEPLMIQGRFIGSYVNADNEIITAKERSDELGRLALRPIKFFFENFKQIVIFEQYKRKIKNLEYVEFELLLFPHDIQNPVKPSLSTQFKEFSRTMEFTETDTDNEDIDLEGINEINLKIIEASKKTPFDKDKDKRLKLAPIKKAELQQKQLEIQAYEEVNTHPFNQLNPFKGNWSEGVESIKDSVYNNLLHSKGFAKEYFKNNDINFTTRIFNRFGK